MKIIIPFLILSTARILVAAEFLYIHGDVDENGQSPSKGKPFQQMLLSDNGPWGVSKFREMVEEKGHRIMPALDRETRLTADLLKTADVVVFSLHQKLWADDEREALHEWLGAGGTMIIFSDSAAGGLWSTVGPQNPVGQRAVNHLVSRYGLQVTVDQADGVRAVRPLPETRHPITEGRPVLEGEGVSLFAVSPEIKAEILIPYENHPEVAVSGEPAIPHKQNITIRNPKWAALVSVPVGKGRIFGIFDRQPFWNAGGGSDITRRDNKLILSRLVDAAAAAHE